MAKTENGSVAMKIGVERRWMACGLMVAGVMLLSQAVLGQTAASPDASPAADPERIVADADKLDYDRSTGWVEARGNVIIRKGTDELRADYVRVNVNTEDAYAYGNVVFTRPGTVWKGERIRYNFGTKVAETGDFTMNSDPFRVIAAKSQRKTHNTYVLSDAKITTCTNEYPHVHYYVSAREVTVVPEDHLKARHAVWHVGRVPFFYMPYWYRNLREDLGFRFMPGYDSRWGAFLLSSYRYRLNPALRAETHVDYRAKRGVAFGQDFKWRDPRTDRWNGKLTAYYADDKEPVEDDEDAEALDVDNDRYRFTLEHEHTLSERDYLLLHAEHVSDREFREDFFEDEYRLSNQPENYFSILHRGDNYVASFLVEGRLNDFYSEVNRLPEVAIDFMRQPIGNSWVYYEGRTAAAYLERTYADTEDEEDYSVFRVDSLHMGYLPTKHFGFLNIIPRAGYRGTYYSDTKETTFTVVTNQVTVTNLVGEGMSPVTSVNNVTETNAVTESKGADFRSLVELGVETSFKAFRTWGGLSNPRRHVAEPYANYTFVPEPSITPDNLYQFDKVDELDEDHSVKLGMRNKLQMKRNGSPFDLADVDVYTILNVDAEEDENDIRGIFFDAEFRQPDWLKIDIDGDYDVEEGNLDEVNTQLRLSATNLVTFDLEHRFRDEDSNLLYSSLTLFPGREWAYNMYGRYEFEDSRMEEVGGYIQRTFDCMAIRCGMSMLPGYTRTDGSEREDEWRVALEYWLTAFPEAKLETGGRHRE